MSDTETVQSTEPYNPRDSFRASIDLLISDAKIAREIRATPEQYATLEQEVVRARNAIYMLTCRKRNKQ